MKEERENPAEPLWGGRQRESCSDLPGIRWQKQGTWPNPRVIKRGSNHAFFEKDTVSCANVLTMQSIAQKSFLVINTKIQLHSHADTCVIDDQCLIKHNLNRLVNVCEYNPKARSKHACTVDAAVAYDESETGQIVIFFINQAVKMKGLGHHILCPMHCCMNGVLIDEGTICQ